MLRPKGLVQNIYMHSCSGTISISFVHDELLTTQILGALTLQDGDVVAEWIVRGTLNQHVAGSSLSAASWLTTIILGQDVNSMPAFAWRGDGHHQADTCLRHTIEI